MIFEFGHQKVDIDVEKTRQFYHDAYEIDCTCDGCVNFVKAVDTLPTSVKSFFADLGIDLKKAMKYSCAAKTMMVPFYMADSVMYAAPYLTATAFGVKWLKKATIHSTFVRIFRSTSITESIIRIRKTFQNP